MDAGDWPSGKATGSGPVIGGSNPSSPASLNKFMNSSERSPIDEFDLLTARLEIEKVTNALGIIEEVVRKYPDLHNTFEQSRYELLESPTAHFVNSEEARMVAERDYPALARIMYVEDDGASEPPETA